MDEPKSEYDFFKLRTPGRTYVSHPFNHGAGDLRILHRLFKTELESKIEKDLNNNLFILTRSGTTYQLKIVIYEKSNSLKQVTIQKFLNNSPTEIAYSFSDDEIAELIKVLHEIQFIDFNNKYNFKIYDKGQTVITIDNKEKELLDFISTISGENRREFIRVLSGQNFTKEDLDILSGRRTALEEFNQKLNVDKDWNELDWQTFFEKNTWIFGYGLDYKFLKILKREAHLSDIDLDGKNDVKGDYLLGSSKFTVLLELKRPDTPLVTTSKEGNEEKGKNRSDSWRLSNDLIDAVTQILAQKSNWQIKGNQRDNYINGEPMIQHTFDPKTILIIGDLRLIKGTSQTQKIKEKTFELFRRDSRNIEIMTYDELYERAYFIVNQKEKE